MKCLKCTFLWIEIKRSDDEIVWCAVVGSVHNERKRVNWPARGTRTKFGHTLNCMNWKCFNPLYRIHHYIQWLKYRYLSRKISAKWAQWAQKMHTGCNDQLAKGHTCLFRVRACWSLQIFIRIVCIHCPFFSLSLVFRYFSR